MANHAQILQMQVLAEKKQFLASTHICQNCLFGIFLLTHQTCNTRQAILRYSPELRTFAKGHI
jgi:hypothetical protein